jgi:hypothetical protein
MPLRLCSTFLSPEKSPALSAVDLNQLRSYFTLDAIQKAVNAFVRDGGRKLDGLVIEQKAQLAVR